MNESKHILDAKPGNELVQGAFYIARRIGPTKPDDTMVICPVCTSQFRAIPLDVQRQLAFLSAPERGERGTSRLGSSARELPAAETAESADERESTTDSPDRRDAAARVASPEGHNRKPSDASLGKDATGRVAMLNGELESALRERCRMSWWNFILSLPVFIVGFVFQWARDMFNRGRAYYDMLTSE